MEHGQPGAGAPASHGFLALMSSDGPHNHADYTCLALHTGNAPALAARLRLAVDGPYQATATMHIFFGNSIAANR